MPQRSDKTEDVKFYVLMGLALVFGLPLIKTVYSNIKDWMTGLGSDAKNQEAIKEGQAAGGTTAPNKNQVIRHSICQGVASSCASLANMGSWYNPFVDHKGIVAEMNKLNNASEALFTSQFFQDKFSESFAAKLKFWLYASELKTIKKVVTDNIF
jgi:hypothetical protein